MKIQDVETLESALSRPVRDACDLFSGGENQTINDVPHFCWEQEERGRLGGCSGAAHADKDYGELRLQVLSKM